MILGRANDAGIDPTSITANLNPQAVLNIFNTNSDGSGLYAQAGAPSNFSGFGAVIGDTNTAKDGVVGLSANGIGVRGRGFPGVQGDGGTGEAGVQGVGVPGVQGDSSRPDSIGVLGTITGNSVTGASGYAMRALADRGPSGPAPVPTSTSVALRAENVGFGAGVFATSTSGVTILGQNTNASNAKPAIQGTTNGSGPAIQATQSGTGRGIYSQITNSSSTTAAIRGDGSAVGRGGVFQGGMAQVYLVPAKGPHPSSGQAGDLFLDNTNSLFLCKGGATWVKIA
jgi:hypothetical protein